VPYKGAVENVLHQLLGGLRAAMGYTGNASIATMQKHARISAHHRGWFGRVTCA
jgi:IMP dehydrogenase